MKYLEDLIREAEDIKVRLKESIDLILCSNAECKLDKTITITVLSKYDSTITSVKRLIDLLKDVQEYKTKTALLDLMTKSKA